MIGYGMTNTGRTVLTAILVGTLGLAAAGILANGNGNAPFAARNGFRDAGLTLRQRHYNCRLDPTLAYCGPPRVAFKRPYPKYVPR